MKRAFIILASSPTLATAQEKTTFDEHVFPIFEQSCLNCHNPDKTKGGLDLSTFSGTLKGSSGGKIVEPGDASSSLMACVLHTAEPKMPPEGDQLAATQIEILKRWIDGGLLENKSSSARKPSKPKFETALRSDPATQPDGPPPMPQDLLLDPPVVTGRASAIHAIATSPWAPVLAITGQRQVLLHHTETLELIGILPFPEGDPVSLNFTPDARYLIVGGGIPGKSGVTVTFDLTTGSRQLTVAKEFDAILASDIRPSFDLIATGGPSRLLKVWNTETGAQVHSVKKHTDWITALDFSSDGVLLASGDRNGGVWVWESQSCNEFHTLRAHQAAITATAFRADSNILATASEDGTVRFWEMNGGSEVKKIDAHPGGVSAFAFGRDGSSVTAGRDLKARFWKADFNHARDLSQKLPSLPTAVALNADATRAFIADSEGFIHAFETATGKPLAEIQANPPTIAARLIALKSRIAELEKKPAAEDAAQPELTSLRTSVKHWSAAAINTRALATRRQADESAEATHEHQDQFTQAAAAVAIQTLALNHKRSEYSQLRNLPPTLLSGEARAELQATLSAVEIRIATELEILTTREQDLLALHQSINQSAPLAHQNKEDLRALRNAYQEALK
jgi:WD40 repeat protein